MNNSVFGQYYLADSIIHKLDPRLKITALLMILITVFFDAGFIGYGIIGIFAIILFLLSKLPMKRIIKAMKPMIFMMVFLFIFNVLLLRQGILLYKIGPFSIYSGALHQSAYIVVRLILIIIFTTILTSTTKPLDMTLGLERLLSPLKKIGFPVYEVSMMISVALRFIPTLIEETQRIMKAQASRGADFNEGTLKEKITAIISLIIPLFISAFQRADDLANAMESRNYQPGAMRTRYHQLKWRYYDSFASLSVFLLMLIIITMSVIL